MLLNSNQIQEIIPHRYPFLLVDQIIEMEGDHVVGVKCVTANEMQFMGHFPQQHVMPGVLVIEALAQAGAVLLLSKEENKGKIALFAGINKARIPGNGPFGVRKFVFFQVLGQVKSSACETSRFCMKIVNSHGTAKRNQKYSEHHSHALSLS